VNDEAICPLPHNNEASKKYLSRNYNVYIALPSSKAKQSLLTDKQTKTLLPS